MRRVVKWLVQTLGLLIGIPVVLVALVILGANLGPGRTLLARAIPGLTGGQVAIAGLSGRFPDALRAASVELRDTKGVYLTLHDVVLDWSPLRLAQRVLDIDRLTATNGSLTRQPEASSGGSSDLPVTLVVHRLQVERLELGREVAGAPYVLSLDGAGRLDSYTAGEGRLAVQRLDASGSYRLDADVGADRIHLAFQGDELPHGLIGAVAGLPDLGDISINASLDGPRKAVATRLAVKAGPLEASAQGAVDLVHDAADLTIDAHAPAMTPRPGLSWQAVALQARVRGPFAKPGAEGALRLDQLEASGGGVQSLVADIAGDQGVVRVRATAEGLRVPGSPPDLFAGAPVTVAATVRFEDPDRPIEFTVRHKLLTAEGSAATAGAPRATVRLGIPRLAPFAAVAGATLDGHADLDLNAATQGGATRLTVTGTIGLDSGMPPAAALIGTDAGVNLDASLQGNDLTVTRFALNGKDAAASVTGHASPDQVDLDWSLVLSDLAALQPGLTGTIDARGHVGGTPQDLSLDADMKGQVAAQGINPGEVSAHLQAQGLPDAPSGRLTAEGTLLDAPLQLGVTAERQADGAVHIAVARAEWNSAHAEGTITVTPPDPAPVGRLSLVMTRLGDLAPLLGKPIAGSIEATLDATPAEARLALTMRDAGLAGTGAVSRGTLNLTVADPTTHPVADGTLSLEGFTAGRLGAFGSLQAKGPVDALAIRLAATLPDLSGAPARLAAAATLNLSQRSAMLASLEADWKQRTVRLLAPTRIEAANGVVVDNLRLGLQQAVLAVNGKVGASLDLSATLRDLPADIVAVASPTLAVNGSIAADARITGTAARPEGTVRLNASGLQLRSGAGRVMPPAAVTATAALSGGGARLDARLTAGSASLTLAGRAPVTGGGALDLRATGAVDLGMAEPLVAAGGRRVAGRVNLDARITGTAAVPRIAGTAQLANGEVQDYQLGLNLRAIAATIEADGEHIRLARFAAQAGPGSINGSGSIGLTAPMPVDLTFAARNASPVANDMLTARLDADLTVAGAVQGDLALGGTVRVRRADLQIPDKLPQNVAVLPVRNPNAPLRTATKPAPAPNIPLNLTISVAQFLVAGHGLDAALAGDFQVRGTAADPQPSGGLRLQRGTLTAVGQALSFSEGSVDFIGAGVTDPALHFVATTSGNNITATLTVSGTARHPTITLSSVPELPQDEILAQIMFHRSVGQLSPFEVAEIAGALAEFSGAMSGNPLARLGKSLGLDRLSLGTNNAGAATIQAGKYVAPGVFLGVRQSASGGSQATLQYDITRRLKVEATTGMGGGNPQGSSDANGSSIGLTYQFEY